MSFIPDNPGHRHIVVEGPIGVGKTRLARTLAERFGSRLVTKESDPNPFLSRFYADRRRHAFETQAFFLLSRYRQQQEIAQRDLFASGTVCDYLLGKDRVFASLVLSEADFALYDRFYTLLAPRLPIPDLVIFLQARPDVLLERIQARGVDYETAIDVDYLQQLCTAYGQLFLRYDEAPLLIVNTSDTDLTGNARAFEALVREIVATRSGVHHFIPG